MTKQEEIREGIARELQYAKHGMREFRDDAEADCRIRHAHHIMEILHSQGVVIKVEKPFRIGGHVDADGVTAFVSLIERKE